MYKLELRNPYPKIYIYIHHKEKRNNNKWQSDLGKTLSFAALSDIDTIVDNIKITNYWGIIDKQRNRTHQFSRSRLQRNIPLLIMSVRLLYPFIHSISGLLNFNCSRLLLSRNWRNPLKHFEISVLRHIRFVVLRKKQFEQPNFTIDYVIWLL